ncbi:MAG: hypothetical protein HC784_10990 [Hydrococcus sp. CSU_1_8]|nr:hypothetical protein [Hydrococcus sp. CSU_1_8]
MSNIKDRDWLTERDRNSKYRASQNKKILNIYQLLSYFWYFSSFDSIYQ